jgi:hypothetical protein
LIRKVRVQVSEAEDFKSHNMKTAKKSLENQAELRYMGNRLKTNLSCTKKLQAE